MDSYGLHQSGLETRVPIKDEEGIKIEVKQEYVEENEVVSTQDTKKYINETAAVYSTDYVEQKYVEENQTVTAQNGETFYIKEADYVEREYFKAESPKSLEYSHDEQCFVALDEAGDYLNADTVDSGTTTASSYESNPKTEMEESNDNEKLTLNQGKEENEHKPRIKTRRGCRVVKSKPKYCESDVECDENELKKCKISSLNMEKARELDAFIAKWKPELTCDLCSETVNNLDQLRTHFRDKHRKKWYIKCCGKKFSRRYLFAGHIQLHFDPHAYKCDICGKPTSSERSLNMHKKLIHELTKELKCSICDRLFKQKVTLKRHLLTHTSSKDFVCSECGKGFIAEYALRHHIRYTHQTSVFCNQCGKTIHGYQKYRRHLIQHAGIEKSKFPCDICGLELTSPNNLKQHKASFHHDGTTMYVCGICGKEAPSKETLVRHKKFAHFRESRHKCTYCGKAFKYPNTLREHVATTHTGQDLYQCQYCPQTYKTNAGMHYHRKHAHPEEWEESRKNRLERPKININEVKKQVVL